MCRFSAPPGYQRIKPIERPTLGPFIGVIDAILSADKQAPPKQRHTAKRIFERLRTEHGYGGGYTTVKNYVHEQRLAGRETFVPLVHPPGHAQVDFGEAIGMIGGVRQKMHVFYMVLPHSDAPFMKAYPAETTEAFLANSCHEPTRADIPATPKHSCSPSLRVPLSDTLAMWMSVEFGPGKGKRKRAPGLVCGRGPSPPVVCVHRISEPTLVDVDGS